MMQASALERIPKRSLTDAVFDQMVARVVTGRWAAGQVLPAERLLCAELGVSRTAVREAMSRMVQLRLVAVRHGGETRVLDFRRAGGLDLLPYLVQQSDGPLTAEVMRAGVEMRAVLGPEMARAAAVRGGAEVADELERVVTEMVAADGDLPVLQDLSLQFWQAVVDGTENLAYQLAFNTLRDAFLGMREVVAAAQRNELRDTDGYRRVARAIRAQDGDEAAKAARAHIALGVAQLHGLHGTATAASRASRKGRTS